MCLCSFTFGSGRGGERESERREAEAANESESVVSHFFSSSFSPPLFSALLSLRCCSPVEDVIVKCAPEKTPARLSADKRIYFPLSLSRLLSLFLHLRCGFKIFLWQAAGRLE